MKNYTTDVRKDISTKSLPKDTVTLFKPVRHDPTKHKIMRPGKTAKDHKSGAHSRRIINQIKRIKEGK